MPIASYASTFFLSEMFKPIWAFRGRDFIETWENYVKIFTIISLVAPINRIYTNIC